MKLKNAAYFTWIPDQDTYKTKSARYLQTSMTVTFFVASEGNRYVEKL